MKTSVIILLLFPCHQTHSLNPRREPDVVGSIPGRDRPTSLKLEVQSSPLGSQDYGSSTMTAPPVSG